MLIEQLHLAVPILCKYSHSPIYMYSQTCVYNDHPRDREKVVVVQMSRAGFGLVVYCWQMVVVWRWSLSHVWLYIHIGVLNTSLSYFYKKCVPWNFVNKNLHNKQKSLLPQHVPGKASLTRNQRWKLQISELWLCVLTWKGLTANLCKITGHDCILSFFISGFSNSMNSSF